MGIKNTVPTGVSFIEEAAFDLADGTIVTVSPPMQNNPGEGDSGRPKLLYAVLSACGLPNLFPSDSPENSSLPIYLSGVQHSLHTFFATKRGVLRKVTSKTYPSGVFCASNASAWLLFLASLLGIPFVPQYGAYNVESGSCA